jgi:hypothetical protein
MRSSRSARRNGLTAMSDDQPVITNWPMFEEAYSKFPVLADVTEARIKWARKFNRSLPKRTEFELAWREHDRARDGRR